MSGGEGLDNDRVRAKAEETDMKERGGVSENWEASGGGGRCVWCVGVCGLVVGLSSQSLCLHLSVWVWSGSASGSSESGLYATVCVVYLDKKKEEKKRKGGGEGEQNVEGEVDRGGGVEGGSLCLSLFLSIFRVQSGNKPKFS